MDVHRIYIYKHAHIYAYIYKYVCVYAFNANFNTLAMVETPRIQTQGPHDVIVYLWELAIEDNFWTDCSRDICGGDIEVPL